MSFGDVFSRTPPLPFYPSSQHFFHDLFHFFVARVCLCVCVCVNACVLALSVWSHASECVSVFALPKFRFREPIGCGFFLFFLPPPPPVSFFLFWFDSSFPPSHGCTLKKNAPTQRPPPTRPFPLFTAKKNKRPIKNCRRQRLLSTRMEMEFAGSVFNEWRSMDHRFRVTQCFDRAFPFKHH